MKIKALSLRLSGVITIDYKPGKGNSRTPCFPPSPAHSCSHRVAKVSGACKAMPPVAVCNTQTQLLLMI